MKTPSSPKFIGFARSIPCFNHDLKLIAQDLLKKQAEYERAGCQIIQPPVRAGSKTPASAAN